jgi:hypothetical protein
MSQKTEPKNNGRRRSVAAIERQVERVGTVSRQGGEHMTPKLRENIYHIAGIVLMLAAPFSLGIGYQHGNPALTLVGVVALVGLVALAVLSIVTSRCPHCDRHIDLRGGSAFCPRCGQWLPLREGELPPERQLELGEAQL